MENEPRLNLVVLNSSDVSKLKSFYEKIGLSFIEEKHGKGPTHYSSTMGEMVLEIYPSKRIKPAGGSMIGFNVNNIEGIIAKFERDQIHQNPQENEGIITAMLRDTDGRSVYLSQKKN